MLIRFQCPMCEELNRPSPLNPQNMCDICGAEINSTVGLQVYVDMPKEEFFAHRVKNWISKEDLADLVLHYDEAMKDVRKLTKEIDVIINGDNAAEQASLCDLIPEIQDLVARHNTAIIMIKTLQREMGISTEPQ